MDEVELEGTAARRNEKDKGLWWEWSERKNREQVHFVLNRMVGLPWNPGLFLWNLIYGFSDLGTQW